MKNNFIAPEKISRIPALKYLMENADQLTLEAGEIYKPLNVRNVTVENSIADLAQFAIGQGTDYKTLRLLNPWLRGKTLTVKPTMSYVILLPAGK